MKKDILHRRIKRSWTQCRFVFARSLIFLAVSAQMPSGDSLKNFQLKPPSFLSHNFSAYFVESTFTFAPTVNERAAFILKNGQIVQIFCVGSAS